VPIETIILLSNMVGADPWVSLPAMANDEYYLKIK
jgi:hypothetical protein